MRSFLIKSSVLLLALTCCGMFLFGQPIQLFVASGGAFSNPDDHVTIAKLDLQTNQTSEIGEVFTQAVQALICHQSQLFLAATDSLVVFDALNYNKLRATGLSGPRMLMHHQNKLFMSVQYPETSGFLKIFDPETLELLSTVDEISDETAGILAFGGKIYVAVPGSWMSTVGKLAVLNDDGSFIEEIDLGDAGLGIFDLYAFQDKVLSINRSPWGATSGSISVFEPVTKVVQHYSMPHAVGKGIGIYNGYLYLLLDHGIGSIELETMQVAQTQIVEDPGSASFIDFAAVVLDTISQRFYATTTDYFSFGQGYVYDLSGNLVDTFSSGISAEALAFCTDGITSIAKIRESELVAVYPNPVNDFLHVSGDLFFKQIQIVDLHGRTVKVLSPDPHGSWNVKDLPKGIYMLQFVTDFGEPVSKKIIKE